MSKEEYCSNCKYGQGITYGWKSWISNLHCWICNKTKWFSGYKKAKFIGWRGK